MSCELTIRDWKFEVHMSIVEFAGTARAGKTTIAQAIENQTIAWLIRYPERHDLAPEEVRDNTYEFDLWYAKFTIQRYQDVLGKPGIHLFERGIIDRIVYGRANYQMGWFNKDQLEEYLALLMPYVDKNDLTFIFRIPVEISLKRAEKMGKDVSKAVPFMEALYKIYSDLNGEFSNRVYLPEDTTLENLEAIIAERLKKL